MKKRYVSIIIMIAFVGVMLYDQTKLADIKPQEINVFAAASLSGAMSEIAKSFEEECKGDVKINCSFAGSGTLKSQIEQGADCDLFISAAKTDMDKLESGDMIHKATRIDLLGNTLTLIASEEVKGFASLETLGQDEIKTIAIGTPEAVPAGQYAMEAIEALGIKETIEGKLVLAKDVKSVVDYVETGNADCGFVYQTDAMLLKSGEVIENLPENTHEPIVYPMALMKHHVDEKESNAENKATDFYEYLKGEYAKSIFERYGFTAL